MAKQVLIFVAAIVLGAIGGSIVMMSLHFASMLIYPLPEGVDFMSQEPENMKRLQDWFASLPAGAFVLAAASHGLGCMAGAVIAMLVSGRKSLVPAALIGIFFTIGGIMNLSSIPHPGWFPIVDLPLYLILAMAAGRFLRKPPATAEMSPTTP